MFVTPDPGVLCWIILREIDGLSIRPGSVPQDTPYSDKLGFVNATRAIEPWLAPLPSTIVADTSVASEFAKEMSTFLKTNVTEYG